MSYYEQAVYLLLAVLCIAWLLRELVRSQQEATHLPVLTLCVDTYDVGSYRIPVTSVKHAQKVLGTLSFTHLEDVRVWDSANERVVASMNDDGVLVCVS